jgi:hypothetical protein
VIVQHFGTQIGVDPRGDRQMYSLSVAVHAAVASGSFVAILYHCHCSISHIVAEIETARSLHSPLINLDQCLVQSQRFHDCHFRCSIRHLKIPRVVVVM